MSQQQPVRDQQVQSRQPAAHDDQVQYPDVSSEEQKVESNPIGGQLNEAANDQERPFGTDVMGDPAKPGDQQTRNFDFDSKSDGQRGEQLAGGQAANPHVQQPESTGPPEQQAQGANPYVQTSSVEDAGKTPMDSLQNVFNKLTKKAEDLTGNAGHYWTHLSTGPNMTETALGRLSAGTKIITGGGLPNVFKKTFPPVSENEQLLKSYACFLSTSTGPVAGTLFLSTERLAFFSDRPLSSNNPSGGEQSWHHYKVAIPLDKVQAVSPSENPKKASEKYIQVETSDQHEFWFMGFISYDKALKSLEETVKARETNKKLDAAGPPQSDGASSPASSAVS